MTELLQIDAGTLTASADDRTVTGLLVPFGEECRSNLGRFSVDTGAFTIPSDTSVVGFNREHAREDVLGRATDVRETPEGIVATFSVARTDEGDAALADIAAGRMKHLSAEVANVVIRAGRAVGGRLFGGALVERPAFPSATLLASDVGVDPLSPDDPEAETTEESSTAPDGTVSKKVTTTKTETDADGTVTTTETVTIVTAEQPAPPAEEEEPPVATATTPNTLAASAPAERLDKATLLGQIATAARSQDPSLMAALSDIKISGANQVGTGVVVPEYVGEVWSGRTFQRRVIPLISSGTLTSLSQKGWRWTTPPEVAEWAGNKAEIPSSSPKTEAVEYAITRFAGGWDIAREFFDFGETAVIDSFLKLAADSYAKKSDSKVLSDLLAGATKGAVGASPEGVSDSMAKLVRGALRVITADALPSFALVATDVYEELLFTKKDDVLEYLGMSLGLEDGSLDSFKIVPHASVAAGNVLVGAKEAAGAYELGGSPIRVNAIDIARGGVDEALFGYIQTRIEYPQGLQLVTPNAA